jgi:hypothetical protein
MKSDILQSSELELEPWRAAELFDCLTRWPVGWTFRACLLRRGSCLARSEPELRQARIPPGGTAPSHRELGGGGAGGSPRDITVQELRIECFIPADDASERAVESLGTIDAAVRRGPLRG